MTARSWLLPSCLLPFIAGAVGHLLTPTRFPRQATPSSSRPILVFNDLQNVVVCSPQLISWFYSGPVAPLGLSITNDGVDQQSSSLARPTPTFTDSGVKVSRRGSSPTSSTIELASSLDPTNKAFLWPVTIPQGWYILTAVIPDASYYTTSARFFVRNAGNTSCGVVFSSSSSSSSSSITSQTTAAASPSTAPSQTSITPPTGATSSAVNVAAIAGGVAGGVALLLLSLFLYIFFVCRPRRSHALPRSSSPSNKGSGLGPSPGSGWGGLGSVDCHAAMGMPSTPKKSHRTARQASHTESFATFVDTAPVEPKYGSPSQEDVLSSRSRRGSVTQPAWYGSPPSEEKLGGSVEEMELEGVPTLGYPINKANLPHHSLSTSTFASELTMGNMGPQRHPSVSSHLPAPIMDTVRDLPTSVPPSLMNSPASPPPATQQQRKPARKPVPVYSPSLDGGPRADAQPESPLPPPPPIAATNSTGIYSPVAGSPPATGGGGGHYSTRGNRRSVPPTEKASGRSKSKTRILGAGSSCESVVDGGESNVKSNGLVHKNSFGPGGVEGKPLHYLVPDILPRG